MDPKDRIIRYIYLSIGLMFLLLGIAMNQMEILKQPLTHGYDGWEKILLGYLEGIKIPW